MRTHSNKRHAGFTLAEMMVVIVIIGLLATLVVPKVLDRLGKAYLTKAKADINQIVSAVNQYAMDNGGRFPESLEQLVQPNEQGDTYLQQEKVPKDPWNHEYGYEPPSGGNNKFRVYSYGRDGTAGGQGDDQDFDNIMIINGDI